MEKIFIIDSVNYLFRSYYAIGPMTNKAGVSTSALYGFIRSIKKLINDFSPKYFICVFDGPDSRASRQTLYSDYKMHRKKAPDDLYPQFDLALNYCSFVGIPTLRLEGVEADDTMATIATWAKKKDFETYICTSDKDLMQMVDDKTFVLNAHKNNELFDEKRVEEFFGIEPKQLLDYLAIVGDKSDNIPGIEGFGPKTATTLLKEFNTLDSIFDNLEKVSSEKKRDILVQEKEKAYLSKKLATLDLNLDIPKDIDFYLLKDPQKEKLESFYKEMNFLTLLKDVTDQKKPEDENLNYQLINSEKELNNLIENLKTEKEIVVDTETTGLNYLSAELVGVGLCIKKTEAFYIPLNGEIDRNTVLAKLKELIENENISFTGHNIKYDYHIFLNSALEIKNIAFDTLLASYLINPQNRRHGLDALTLEKFNIAKTPIKDLIGIGKKQISMKDVPLDRISNYCSEDVDYTFRLKELFEKEIKDNNLEKVLYDIEMPLLKVLAKMERHGIFVDKDMLSIMSEAIHKKLNLLEGEIFSEAGKQFNINSPKQLSEVLYVDLAITPPKKKGSTFSTSADILEKLKGKSPIIDHILRFREYQKLLSTYVDAIPKQINPITNRVHSSFSQSTTATGRLASKNPNLQNIPIRSEEGKKIREGFRPEKDGWFYLSSDYSQIELKFLAHFSEDPNLIKAFNNGDDIHAFTASLVYSLPIEEVTKQMRSNAKAVNFGIIYGQSAFGLSEQIGISIKEAKAFIDTYFERYPNILKYLDNCKKLVHEKKIAYTITGRQRPIIEIDNKNPFIRAAAERLSINTPLQGSAADLIKIAMIEIDKEITKRELKGYMILQIHDELLFEVPEDEIEIFKSFVKDKMENVFDLKVPLTVDIEIGKNLAEC
ncbi:MAG: DNA polymerase I [Candidatus Anoxychlamydiales bacterium]|nr:DNA polymerase I [Candidatus Anoxychlamydiales bacterium]